MHHKRYSVSCGRGLVAIALVGGVAACESTDRTEDEPRIHTPLYFDPTEEYDLAEWWTNGNVLLNLRPNYTYAIYLDNNRYKEPVERGQWSQLSYAALQFEPYSLLNARVERIAIDKDSGGELVLVIPNVTPLAGVDRPPFVLEDLIVGSWIGDAFSINLRENLRYEFQRLRDVPLGETARGAHDGSWELVEDTVILRPDPIALEPILIRTTLGDNQIVLKDLVRRSALPGSE